MCATCPTHFILLDLKLLIMQSSPASHYFSPNINTLFSNTLTTYFLPLVWKIKFHTHTRIQPWQTFLLFMNLKMVNFCLWSTALKDNPLYSTVKMTSTKTVSWVNRLSQRFLNCAIKFLSSFYLFVQMILLPTFFINIMQYEVWLWSSGMFLLQAYLYTYSLLRGVTFKVLPLSSYALSPMMLQLLETFLELMLCNSF